MPAGLDVVLPNLSRDIAVAKAAYEAFASDKFPRAVQFVMNRAAIEGTNGFRDRVRGGEVFDRHNAWIERGVAYDLDRTALGSVGSLEDVKSRVHVPEPQSVVMKYAFGEDTRTPGDVGIESMFPRKDSLYIPAPKGLAKAFGIRTDSSGRTRVEDVRRIASMAAEGYKRNTASGGKWGVFEVRRGDPMAAHYAPGIWARPPRSKEATGRRKEATGTGQRFDDARGRDRNLQGYALFNQDVPRLLFRSTPSGDYEPKASQSWSEAMLDAAAKMPGWFEEELMDKLDHLASQRGSGRGWR